MVSTEFSGEGRSVMMMGFGAILTVLCLGGLAYMLGWRLQTNQQMASLDSPGGETALDVLKVRYACGEIPKDEYETMRADLLV